MGLERAVAKNYFFIKRLHSLLGVFPLAFFLLEHFLVNSLSLQGAGRFNSASEFLESLPFLLVWELGLIVIPLYIHGFLGLWLVMQGSVETRVPYIRNWLYLLQRATGIFTLIFVTYHIIATRIWSKYVLHTEDLYALMQNYLKIPYIFAIYLLGVICASFHVGNGLFNFTYKWGITVSERSQTFMMILSWFIALAFIVIGVGALFGFIK